MKGEYKFNETATKRWEVLSQDESMLDVEEVMMSVEVTGDTIDVDVAWALGLDEARQLYEIIGLAIKSMEAQQ